jgi:hypothetical protein
MRARPHRRALIEGDRGEVRIELHIVRTRVASTTGLSAVHPVVVFGPAAATVTTPGASTVAIIFTRATAAAARDTTVTAAAVATSASGPAIRTPCAATITAGAVVPAAIAAAAAAAAAVAASAATTSSAAIAIAIAVARTATAAAAVTDAVAAGAVAVAATNTVAAVAATAAAATMLVAKPELCRRRCRRISISLAGSAIACVCTPDVAAATSIRHFHIVYRCHWHLSPVTADTQHCLSFITVIIRTTISAVSISHTHRIVAATVRRRAAQCRPASRERKAAPQAARCHAVRSVVERYRPVQRRSVRRCAVRCLALGFRPVRCRAVRRRVVRCRVRQCGAV